MDEELSPLPETERQLKALQKIYGTGQSRIYIGAQASEETFKNEAPSYRILHLATHGILNDKSPMYSHLLLSQTETAAAQDGLLEAWEIMNLDLKADLAVLSACETARGRVSNGEGVIGLTWALFVAGVPTTVASQWKVESESTTQLMVEFHRNLRSNKSKSESLRQAALKLLRTKKYSHPFYWGGFIVLGDPR
jgi:CHAT domain-containing protein